MRCNITSLTGSQRLQCIFQPLASQRHWGIAMLFCLLFVGSALADTIWFKEKNKVREVTGNVLGMDQEGTLLLEGQDTQHYFIEKDARVRWERQNQTERLYSKEQLRAHLRKELGANFRVETRQHYVIAYSCSPEFASHAGQILERVHDYFINFFRNKGGFRFEPLRQPLVAILYKSRDEYLKSVSPIAEMQLDWSGGVYLQQTNRFYTYEQSLDNGDSSNDKAAKAALSPTAVTAVRQRNIQTIVHEGVHQLAFNMGFHSRYSYNPKWLVEGMATYFEAADLNSSLGWSGAGQMNTYQMQAFQQLYPRLKDGFLQALIVDDDAFMDARANADAYAAAWAVNYYLMRSKTRGYVRYLHLIRERPISPYTAEERVADFKTAFGKSPANLELDFRRFMAPLLADSRE